MYNKNLTFSIIMQQTKQVFASKIRTLNIHLLQIPPLAKCLNNHL